MLRSCAQDLEPAFIVNCQLLPRGHEKPRAARDRSFPNQGSFLRKKLNEAKLPFKKNNGIDPDQCEGFREATREGTMFTVKASSMRKWFANNAQYRAALFVARRNKTPHQA